MWSTEHKPAKNDRRRAWESRLWRLAYLLTGSAEGAGHVLERVLMARPNLTSIVATARVDRLVALHTRERTGRTRAGRRRFSISAYTAAAKARRVLDDRLASAPEVILPGSARRLHDLVLALDHQPRLAWLLTHIEQVDEVWMAKAMDCSKNAARVHLARAEKALLATVSSQGESDDPASTIHEGVRSLREAADAIDPGPYLEAARADIRERRVGRIAVALIVVAVMAFAVKVVLDLVRS